MTELRERYEAGMMHMLDSYIRCKAKWGSEDQFTHEQWENLRGYVAAGLFTDIITNDEFRAVSEELLRWRYH